MRTIKMRLDHIAYRVSDREKTAKFFKEAFGYIEVNRFPIIFDNGSTSQCIALEPPEKVSDEMDWECCHNQYTITGVLDITGYFHLAPEIFVSDGTPDSIVGKWVAARDGIGGVHHLAYQVDSPRKMAQEWLDSEWGEFSGDVLTCPEDDLEQVFSKPHPLTGVIYEFIKRGKNGFCEANVQRLMESTKDNR